jgi:hypothetical protein
MTIELYIASIIIAALLVTLFLLIRGLRKTKKKLKDGAV